MDITELKKLKEELREDIDKLMADFEDFTGCNIRRLDLLTIKTDSLTFDDSIVRVVVWIELHV